MAKKYEVFSSVKFPAERDGWEKHDDVKLNPRDISFLAKKSEEVTFFIFKLNEFLLEVRKQVLNKPETIARIVACAKEQNWFNKLEIDIGDKFQIFFDIRVTPEDQKSWRYTLNIEAVRVLYDGERVYCNPSYGVTLCV